jgi:UDPglucose 6-dehydrogenase
LAHLGNQVTAVDASKERLDSLKAGQVPFFEPNLDDFVKACVASGNLDFTDNVDAAVKRSEVVFIAVGTPPLPTGEPDLTQVMNVARSIGSAMDSSRRRIIVNKSTVPVGSGNWVEMLVNQGVQSAKTVGQVVGARATREDKPTFAVVSNPEFLREGTAIFDSFYPDRIVLGSQDQWALSVMQSLYEPIVNQTFVAPHYAPRPLSFTEVPLVTTDLASAELIKYSANAFLAIKIGFANEIACLCEKVGADIRQVTHGIGLDKRIGASFLNAGIGWGGSCFGKDINALMHVAGEYHCETALLEAALAVNERQRLHVIKKLQEELKIVKGRTIGLLGLSFKPETDDLRDAASITIASHLIKIGAAVRAYDPVSNSACKRLHPELDLSYCHNSIELATECDAVVLITEWDEFKKLDWKKVASVMRGSLIVDGRNVLDEKSITDAGLSYRGIGH